MISITGPAIVSFLTVTDETVEFSLKVAEFTEFSDKKYLPLKELKPATSFVRDQDVTTEPAGHRYETISCICWIHWIAIPFGENSSIL